MACTGKTVASHSAVIFLFVCRLTIRCKTYDDISRTDVCVVDHVAALHSAGHCRVHNDRTHEVSHVSCLATGCIYAHSHLAKLSKKLVRSVDDGTDDLTRYKKLVASDCGRDEDVVDSSYAEEVVDIHNKRVLGYAFPYTQVTCLLPVKIGKG